MKKAIKNQKKLVKAYQLGVGNPMEKTLIEEGAILVREDGSGYELFSQEAVNGKGELAQAGDFFKVDLVDGKHYPYPNKKNWFMENHVHVEGDTYEQKPKPNMIWQVGDSMEEEIAYLIDNKLITIKEDDEANYFNAFLWGAELSAAKDATVLFYAVNRDEKGAIISVDFNFVAAPEFEKSYTMCE